MSAAAAVVAGRSALVPESIATAVARRLVGVVAVVVVVVLPGVGLLIGLITGCGPPS